MDLTSESNNHERWTQLKHLLLIISLLANLIFLWQQYRHQQAARHRQELSAEGFVRNLGAAAFYFDEGLRHYEAGKAEAAAGQLSEAVDGLESAAAHLARYMQGAVNRSRTGGFYALPIMLDQFKEQVDDTIHALYRHERLTPEELQELQSIQHDIGVVLEQYPVQILLSDWRAQKARIDIVCEQLQSHYNRVTVC